MKQKVIKYCYFIIGTVSTIFGIIGIFLPLMPTTCFLIAAVWAFTKSYPQFSQKILEHKKFGPPIQDWMEHRTINKKLKMTISTSILLGFSITFLLVMPTLITGLFLLLIMFSLLCYINTRPEKDYEKNNTVSLEIDERKLLS